MDEKAICAEGRIWDLHIHSNQCTSADDSIKDLSANEYVDQLFDLFDNYELLDMISFTDHNQINLEVYQAFLNSDKNKGSVVLLPGCEIDVKLDDEGSSKHLVVYFDAINKLKELERISEELNGFFKEKAVSAENPILIDKLLNKLTDLKATFVLSPHAFKQDKRAIDSDWHPLSPEERNTSKFIDQFFCFWEASGYKYIAHAKDFLKQMDCGNKQSVVSFSDSRSLVGIRKYLEDPCQYFHALPNFTGLQMTGSDVHRITETSEEISSEDLGRYIGCLEFDGKQIQCSPCMNAIIGGRGSGKSVLLDSVANQLSASDSVVPNERLNFLNEYDISVKNACGESISRGSFNFDYFDQSYIAKLFILEGESFNKKLESYFSEAFEKVEPINSTELLLKEEERFLKSLADYSSESSETIVGLVDKLADLKDDKLNIKLYKKDKVEVEKSLSNYNYEEGLRKIDAALNTNLPEFLKNDENIDAAILSLKTVVTKEAHKLRLDYLNSAYLHNRLIDNFVEVKNTIDAAHKARSAVLEQVDKKLLQLQLNYMKRVNVVNAYLATAVDFHTRYEKSCRIDGEEPEAFCFKKTLDIEHPLEHMLKLFEKYITQPKGAEKSDAGLLWAYINLFCFSEDCYKSEKSWEPLYEELKGFNLKCTPGSSIWYKEPTQDYENVADLSPGTQTNILLEYIVYKDTNSPLLIDQPEDNVDNRTIYGKIKNWFLKLKSNRQVFVVTHDANIVINADAENIIIAEQNEPGVFSYTFGALEYDDNVNKAATILDGGKEAVQRRLLKYGEQ